MSEPIKLYTPGRGGLNIDSDPFLQADDELQVAENAFHDPVGGKEGALRKRPGLTKFNLVAAGGAILGGITMPVIGTGGAPQPTGTGSTGDDTGTGDGTGSPGGTFDGSGDAEFAPDSSIFGGGSLFSGARLIVVGRDDNAGDEYGTGWYVTSKGLADTALSVTTPGPPMVYSLSPRTAAFPFANGRPMFFDTSSRYIYYASNHNQETTAGSACPIRKTNGANDTLFTTIALATAAGAFSNENPSTGVTRPAITGMWLSGNYLYVTVCDKSYQNGDGVPANYGRVFRIHKTTADQTEVVMTTNAIVPYCITYFNGHPFWGAFNLAAGSEVPAAGSTPGIVYGSSTDLLTGTQDHAFNGTTGGTVISCMLPFPADDTNNQCLFVGLAYNGSDELTTLYVRDRSVLGTSTAYTASKQPTTGGAIGANEFRSLCEFNGKLYASFLNSGVFAKIYELTPNYSSLDTDGYWDGTGTWAEVFSTTTASEQVAFDLYADDGVLYAIGMKGIGAFTSVRAAYTTTDGTSWTARTSNLGSFANQSYALPFFMGLDQS